MRYRKVDLNWLVTAQLCGYGATNCVVTALPEMHTQEASLEYVAPVLKPQTLRASSLLTTYWSESTLSSR